MHSHHEENMAENRLGAALVITFVYMIVEVLGGLYFNSLALLADAGHMLSDAAALGLSWFAIRVGKRSPTDRHTYGFQRTEILAALFNGLALWALSGVIVYESVSRIFNPRSVDGKGMFIIAGMGLLLNLLTAYILFNHRKKNLNIRGAFLHVVSDALGSLGARMAALGILLTGSLWADPIASVFICLLILYSSLSLVKESLGILMEAVPFRLDIRELESQIMDVEGICCIYDLHVWSLSSEETALSCHVVLSDICRDSKDILIEINKLLTGKYKITHSTIQLETDHDMRVNVVRDVCRAGTACDNVS
jgi:cobalt-zinc-cadmium efflux system protein